MKLIGFLAVLAFVISLVSYVLINNQSTLIEHDYDAPLDFNKPNISVPSVPSVQTSTDSYSATLPISNSDYSEQEQKSVYDAKFAGDALDADEHLSLGATELISIGDFIDPESELSSLVTSEVKFIGEYIDPELTTVPAFSNKGIINIGEFIDADEYFYGARSVSDKLISLGEPLDVEEVKPRSSKQ